MSLCMEQMSAAERRVGRERADEEIRCQVRGKFGSDADEDTDDMLPDTRWVKLSELTDNIREADLKALDEFTRGLNKAIKDARRRLRQCLAQVSGHVWTWLDMAGHVRTWLDMAGHDWTWHYYWRG